MLLCCRGANSFVPSLPELPCWSDLLFSPKPRGRAVLPGLPAPSHRNAWKSLTGIPAISTLRQQQI